MSPDAGGMIVAAVSILLYFATRKTNPKLAAFLLFTAGIGVGIVLGAVWSYNIITSLF